MTPQLIFVDVMIALGTVIACASVLGMLVMRDPYQRLHYLAPASTVSPICYTIALIAESGWHQAAVKALLITVVLLAMNAVLTHATARAFRIKQQGRWTTPPITASKDEQQPGKEAA